MTFEQRAVALAQGIGGSVRTLLHDLGELAALTTTNKESLVGAINELKQTLGAIDLTALISDGTTTTENAWSVDKIIAALTAAKQDIIDGAPQAYDTLKEISDYLAANDVTIGSLLTDIGSTVRYDASQSLLGAEQFQACDNIGIADYDIDLVSIFSESMGGSPVPPAGGASSPEVTNNSFNFTAATTNNGSSSEVTGGNFAF